MAGFACQTGVKRDLRQEDPTLGMRRVARDETLGCLGARQLVRFRRQGERRKVGMRRALPGVRDAGLRHAFRNRPPAAGWRRQAAAGGKADPASKPAWRNSGLVRDRVQRPRPRHSRSCRRGSGPINSSASAQFSVCKASSARC